MGNYPRQYSQPAIQVAEAIVKTAVESRLVKEGWIWKCSGPLLTNQELDAIRLRFAPGVSNSELVRFIGLVFSKVLPQIHYEFTSDGYYVVVDGDAVEPVIIVDPLPTCSTSYEQTWRQGSYQAALAAVRSLIEWRLTSFREVQHQHWPIGEYGGADLVHGELYRWIKGLGDFDYCRPKNVIEFIRAAVPEMFEQWENAGLILIPRYHVMSNGNERFTSLQLVQQSPA